MSHQPNWQEYGAKVGQDKASKDVPEAHDAIYGKYACNVNFKGGGYKSTALLPAEPSPFILGTKK